jgi:hypothetical protein
MWSKVVESGKRRVRFRGKWSKVDRRANEPEKPPN